MMFRPKTPRAGSVRIGKPPSASGKAYPSKIDYFEFCLSDKEGKYYERDERMHEIFGDKPKIFGPVFLASDSLIDSMNMQFSWWGGGSVSRRKCFKMFDPFCGGDVMDGRDASRLTKDNKGNISYKDYGCAANQCKDFQANNRCSQGLCYKFLIPQAHRLGEYWLSAKSFQAINSAFGFIELMRKRLEVDPETGSLIGISRIPLAFVLREGSVRFQGKDTKLWYPELTIDSNVIDQYREVGIYNALPQLVQSDQRRMLSSPKTTSRYQEREASQHLIEAPVGDNTGVDMSDDDAKEEEVKVEVKKEVPRVPEIVKKEVLPLPEKKEVVIEAKEKVKVKEEKDPDKKVSKLDSLVDSIVEDSKGKESTLEIPMLYLLYQDVTSEGTLKRSKKVESVPDMFVENKDNPGIWVSHGEDNNDVQFIVDVSNPALKFFPRIFTKSDWVAGKFAFQLASKDKGYSFIEEHHKSIIESK